MNGIMSLKSFGKAKLDFTSFPQAGREASSKLERSRILEADTKRYLDHFATQVASPDVWKLCFEIFPF